MHLQNIKEQLAVLESVCQTKEDLLQAKEAEAGHLTKVVEIKQKMISEMQLSSKVRYDIVYVY